MKISASEYNKLIGKILDDPNLEVADKLIKAVQECGHYQIVDDSKSEYQEKEFVTLQDIIGAAKILTTKEVVADIIDKLKELPLRVSPNPFKTEIMHNRKEIGRGEFNRGYNQAKLEFKELIKSLIK